MYTARCLFGNLLDAGIEQQHMWQMVLSLESLNSRNA